MGRLFSAEAGLQSWQKRPPWPLRIPWAASGVTPWAVVAVVENEQSDIRKHYWDAEIPKVHWDPQGDPQGVCLDGHYDPHLRS